jgi:hypothetical protein
MGLCWVSTLKCLVGKYKQYYIMSMLMDEKRRRFGMSISIVEIKHFFFHN